MNLVLSPVEMQEAIGPASKRSGLRPDIEKYIKEEAKGSRLKQHALAQLAQDYQKTLANIMDANEAIPAAKKAVHSEFCVRYAFKDLGHYETSKLHAQMLNTYVRARIGIRMNTYMAKAYPYLPEESEWAKDCRFDVKKDAM